MANTVLSVFNLQKTFELEPVFSGVSFQLNAGEKVALVGPNGAGKTTLLEIIAGLDTPDTGHGQIVKGRGVRVVYLPQEVSGFGDIAGDHHLAPETSLWEAMLDAMGDIRELERDKHRLEEAMSAPGQATSGPLWDSLMREYEAVTHRFEIFGGYEMEHRIEQTLEGLGFRPSQFDVPIGVMSGGQKTRAALSRTLLRSPDLLLLDEPTNHLDLNAIEWLETFLATWSGTLLSASHDRRFLDRVTTRTLDMEHGTLVDYPAPYTRYLRLKADRLERQLAEYHAQQAELGRTEEYIRRYKAGQRSREAKGRAKRLERVVRLQAPRSRDQLKLELQAHLRSGLTVLATEDLVVGYHLEATGAKGPGSVSANGVSPNGASPNGTKPGGAGEDLVLVRCPDLEIERGERVALVGPNGAGKTTLLKTVTGEIPPLRGEAELGHNVSIAYYAQAHEGLDPTRTVLDEILRSRPMSEEQARTLLGRFLFSGDDVFKKVGDLSGGERSRVALAKLTLADANFLLLDEPTNHLDLAAREALEDVLTDYRGTLLFVSHDRAFIDALATQVWVLDMGRLEAFDGNYSDYHEEVARRRRDLIGAESGAGKPHPAPGKPGANGHLPPNQAARAAQRAREEAERQAAKARAAAQRQVAQLEVMITQLEDQLNLLTAELEAASAAQDIALVADVGREYQQLADELERKYAEWETIAAAVQ
jgi:ATP-binding cassette subfamily F protein 3